MSKTKKILPEEDVRNQLLDFMKGHLGYPKEKISVERSLSAIPHLEGKKVPNRRFDIVVFGKENLYPLLLIECKAIPFNQSAVDQVKGYNHLIQAPFIALANQSGVLFYVKDKNTYKEFKGLAPYQYLLDQVEGA